MKRAIYLLVCLLAAAVPTLGAAIHAAAVAGNEELLQKLLTEQPQQVNAVDSQLGATPLHLAAQFGRAEAVRLLLDRGADVRVKDRYGRTAVETAVTAGHTEVVAVLREWAARSSGPEAPVMSPPKPLPLPGKPTESKPAKNKDDFFAAVRGGDADAVQELLVEHPSWARAADEHNKPVFLMVPMGKAGLVIASYLLQNGANVNCADSNGKTLLHEAVRRGQLELVKLLIAQGARVTVRNKKGESPIDVAARSGRTEILEFLKQAKDQPGPTTRP